MWRAAVETVSSAIAVFVAGYLLWPPGGALPKWWTALPEAVRSEVVVLALLAILSAAVGIGLTAVGAVRLASFAVGGVLAYVVGMTLVRAALSPDSPVHLLLYSYVLVAMVLGADGWRRIGTDRGSYSESRTGST